MSVDFAERVMTNRYDSTFSGCRFSHNPLIIMGVSG